MYKITATLIDCTWNWAAIVEIHDTVLVGGIPACGGGWHEHPRKGYLKIREEVIYAADKEKLVKKLEYLYARDNLTIAE